MSARLRLSSPALLAVLLAASIGPAPAPAASAARLPAPAPSGLADNPAPTDGLRGAGLLALRGQARAGVLFIPALAAGIGHRAIAGGHDRALAGATGLFRWFHHGAGSFGSALAGSAPVLPGPSAVAVDRATNTIYVASGYNADGPTNAGGDTVSVIDGRRCQARDVSECKGPWPTVKVGRLPSNITVDQATHTVYVAVAGDNTVAVFNSATCNGRVSWGCRRAPAHVRVGPGPFGIVADNANHTVYVTSPGLTGSGTTMSMINTLTCDAAHLAGCSKQRPPKVDVGATPLDVTVNQASHTLYVTTIGRHRAQNGWAVFNANTCDAATQRGCAKIGRLIGDRVGPEAGVIDTANDTLYTANFDNTLSAFDLRRCDAAHLAGCAAQKPGTVTVAPSDFFEVAWWLVVDAPLHTVFVVNQKDDTLSAVNTDVCNGRHLRACATLRPPTIHTGEDPESVAVNTATQTLYTANQVTNDVSVISAARCNATVTRGCRRPPAALALPSPGALAADPAAGTLYAAINGTHTVAMIGTRACNARRHHGCNQAPPRATVGAFPAGIAVDQRTHTVYVANGGTGTTGTVTVLDDRACNAATSSGCATARTLQVPGGNPAAIAVNPVTDTVYVATVPPGGAAKRSIVSVFNGATCNAATSTGCGQAPQAVTVGFLAAALGVNAKTDTIYVANFARKNAPFAGNTVSVIDGATCNATTTGCGNTPATVTLGPAFTSPIGVAVDQHTDTVYIANLENGEGPGTVSVINGAACNATATTGCGKRPPTASVGFGPSAIAFDPANRTVAVTNIEDTSVSIINAATCNATNHTGCHHTQPRFPAGRAPGAVAIDPTVGTIYTANGDNTISIIPAIR